FWPMSCALAPRYVCVPPPGQSTSMAVTARPAPFCVPPASAGRVMPLPFTDDPTDGAGGGPYGVTEFDCADPPAYCWPSTVAIVCTENVVALLARPEKLADVPRTTWLLPPPETRYEISPAAAPFSCVAAAHETDACPLVPF